MTKCWQNIKNVKHMTLVKYKKCFTTVIRHITARVYSAQAEIFSFNWSLH